VTGGACRTLVTRGRACSPWRKPDGADEFAELASGRPNAGQANERAAWLRCDDSGDLVLPDHRVSQAGLRHVIQFFSAPDA